MSVTWNNDNELGCGATLIMIQDLHIEVKNI